MDIICFSHIKWNFVYQRPQHLLYRFAVDNRVFIIEEPIIETSSSETSSSDYYEITRPDEKSNLRVVTMHISQGDSILKTNSTIKAVLDSMIYANSIKNYISWYYTPMALSYSEQLNPVITIYDCMDELSAFKFAPAGLKEWEQKLFLQADLVFTGGYSLYNEKKHLHHNIHPFPSSIDHSHFLQSRTLRDEPSDQASIPHPRFGFYGVIDERFHLDLISKLAALRPEWHFVLIGPVAKIDPATLPQSPNIHYPGRKEYKDLPAYLAGWDVAILPFELNDSTRFISPTKTPEYLAGGKPVISTSITDVVNPYGKMGLVHIADNATDFIKAAETIFNMEDKDEWLAQVDAFLSTISWNKTWAQMSELINETIEKKTIIKPTKQKIYV